MVSALVYTMQLVPSLVLALVGLVWSGSAQSSETLDLLKKLVQDIEELKSERSMMVERLNSTEQELKRIRDVPKVAFAASLGDGLQKTTSGNKVLIYRDVLTNEGRSYNPQTGVFTAPVRGVYLVMFTANAPADFPLSAVLYRNSVHIELIAHEQESGTGSDTASNSATLVLDQGDTLHMVLWHNTQIWDNSNHHSTFSGALLFPLDQNVNQVQSPL